MPIRVAVIGGGAAGLCAARYLRAKPDVFQAVVYEQADQIGGTWVYTENVGKDKYGLPVHSSMYQRLRTNLPKELMMYPGLPITEGGRTSFIKHTEVLQYMNRYAWTYDLHKCIQLLTRVQSVKPIVNCNKTSWEVTVKSVKDPDATPQVNEFDAVMVCNGQYAVPSYPNIPGLETFSGKVIHSHEYRHPEDFKGQTVVLFGAGFSGRDICVDLHTFVDKIYLSHHIPNLDALLPDNLRQVPDIKSIDKGRVVFTDGQSVEADVLMLCTGYLYDFPFLTPECEVVVDRKRISPLYKHVLHTKHTSLSFIGVVWTISPFQLLACQVRFAMAALDGTMVLPSRTDMDADAQCDYEYRRDELKYPHHYAHKMDHLQWEYDKELLRLANVVDDDGATLPLFKELYDATNCLQTEDLVNYKKRIIEISDDWTSWQVL
ncbi:flavin-containing monooxygenase FMO GS-OX-like 2 isoform X4 [Patiria miniata]|uniref:Flavin-containing monooxygenase n=1 Tax=Patiria miniata TaxID=46514 RepID=A0A914ATW0_PATMI|nr:flavin-containing monooxygenase FMO GS-OX-like 2 isoform X4 [Patiria miniata]